MKKYCVLIFVFIFTKFNCQSQSRIIEGRVISEQLETLPGVFIFIDDSLIVGMSDIAGFFKVEIPSSENLILFKGVGIMPTFVQLEDQCNKIEVVIFLSESYDFARPTSVERKKKNRINQRYKIYNQAYKRELFENDSPCYTRVWIQ